MSAGSNIIAMATQTGFAVLCVLLQMRVAVVVVAHGQDHGQDGAITATEVDVNQSNCSPEQVHLSLVQTSPHVELIVQWATGSQCASQVSFGLDAGDLNATAAAHTWRHIHGNALGRQWLHRARIAPGDATTCFYRACSGEECSKIFWTNTPALLLGHSARRTPLKYLVFGDLGLASGLVTIARLRQVAQTGEYVAMFHIGDIAYDMHDEGGRRGDRFLREMEGAAAYLPYMVAPGNHETDFGFHPYLNRFSMPVSRPGEIDFLSLPAERIPSGLEEWPRPLTKATTDTEPLFYSIDIGLVHFIAYDTESVYERQHLRATTRRWLQNDLVAANKRRREVPWIVAFGHRPMYCSNAADNECKYDKPTVRLEFEKIFFDGGVDLILEGHEHSYERFYPTFNRTMYQTNYVNPRAPVHIITGQTGCSESFLGLCTNPIFHSGYEWSAYRSWYPGLNGYGRITVLNETHLVWEQVLDHFFQATMDQITLQQDRHGPFNTP